MASRNTAAPAPGPWRVVPTRRRTSKANRADILDANGAEVAGYLLEIDAVEIVAAVSAARDGEKGGTE